MSVKVTAFKVNDSSLMRKKKIRLRDIRKLLENTFLEVEIKLGFGDLVWGSFENGTAEEIDYVTERSDRLNAFYVFDSTDTNLKSVYILYQPFSETAYLADFRDIEIKDLNGKVEFILGYERRLNPVNPKMCMAACCQTRCYKVTRHWWTNTPCLKALEDREWSRQVSFLADGSPKEAYYSPNVKNIKTLKAFMPMYYSKNK